MPNGMLIATSVRRLIANILLLYIAHNTFLVELKCIKSFNMSLLTTHIKDLRHLCRLLRELMLQLTLC